LKKDLDVLPSLMPTSASSTMLNRRLRFSLQTVLAKINHSTPATFDLDQSRFCSRRGGDRARSPFGLNGDRFDNVRVRSFATGSSLTQVRSSLLGTGSGSGIQSIRGSAMVMASKWRCPKRDSSSETGARIMRYDWCCFSLQDRVRAHRDRNSDGGHDAFGYTPQ